MSMATLNLDDQRVTRLTVDSTALATALAIAAMHPSGPSPATVVVEWGRLRRSKLGGSIVVRGSHWHPVAVSLAAAVMYAALKRRQPKTFNTTAIIAFIKQALMIAGFACTATSTIIRSDVINKQVKPLIKWGAETLRAAATRSAEPSEPPETQMTSYMRGYVDSVIEIAEAIRRNRMVASIISAMPSYIEAIAADNHEVAAGAATVMKIVAEVGRAASTGTVGSPS